ncbi:MAG TPA: hypothetical protein VJV78_31385 [Polyangiales bacterium]|nr:hypothetical protein [Polyangiales bacterium]
MSISRIIGSAALGLTLMAAGAGGCSGDDDSTPTEHEHDVAGHGGAPDTGDTDLASQAADLRVNLNLLLSEHMDLAAKATGAALGGRSDEFKAYGALLNDNGNDIGALVGAAFGNAAKTQFNGIWSAHNGYFVDYTAAVADKNADKQAQAVKDLTERFVPEFSKLISDATALPQDDVKDLTMQHVLMTKAVVDAQAKHDWPATYAAIREATAHMAMIGTPLASAIAKKFPNRFPGDSSTAAVDFRVALNQGLQEHMFLATFATGAALGGRADEFAAAGDALNDNGTELGAVIGDLYGAEARSSFNSVWSAHNGYFVAYTEGVAAKDEAKQAKAVDELTNDYVPDFAKLISGATGLPMKAVSDLALHHVLATKAVVDAQAALDMTAAADADREAGRHMQMIADPLATAIVAKLPAKF